MIPSQPLRDIVLIVGVFVGAILVARFSAFVARHVLAWHDRRNERKEQDLSGKIASIRRRETTVALIRAAITYAAFAGAALVAVAQLSGGFDRLTALAGASFALVLAGFAIQRFLMDIIAGLSMFAERWYSVGDYVKIAALDLEGVVEDVSLRSTRLRTVNGEMIHVHNSQIPGVRVLPRGVKELTAEFFVTDKGRGEALVHRVAGMLPEGPTTFVRRPSLELVEDLSERLVRVKVRAVVPPGREWLVESLLATLLREQADEELILHGPIVLADDEGATRSFARATSPRGRLPAASKLAS